MAEVLIEAECTLSTLLKTIRTKVGVLLAPSIRLKMCEMWALWFDIWHDWWIIRVSEYDGSMDGWKIVYIDEW